MGSEKHPQTVWNRAASQPCVCLAFHRRAGEARTWLKPQAGYRETANTTSRGLITVVRTVPSACLFLNKLRRF